MTHRPDRPVAIAQRSIVAGSSTAGIIGAFGSLYQLAGMVMEGRIWALPASLNSSLNLVPIDHVVGARTDIAERLASADGQIFHLTSDKPGHLAPLATLAEEFPHLHGPRFVLPERSEPARLSTRQ